MPTSIQGQSAGSSNVKTAEPHPLMKSIQSVFLLKCAVAVSLFSISMAHADTLYVTCGSNIEMYDSTTGSHMGTLGQTYGGGSLALDSQGNLFALCPDSMPILKFVPGGNGTIFSYEVGQAFTFGGIAVDRANNVYVAAGAITTLAPNGRMVDTPFNVHDVDLGWLSGLAFDSADNLYAASWSLNTVMGFARTGAASVFATGLNHPTGITFDNSGNLYVANFGGNSIVRFAPDGTGSVFASTGLNQPVGIAFDGSGNLLAVNSGNNTIEKFSPEGTDMGTLTRTSSDHPSFIAIRVVPEPSTLGFSAFGLIGIWVRCIATRRPERKVPHAQK
jgi:hypothetical protein